MKPAKEIPRIEPIDRSTFYAEYVKKAKPVIIKSLAENWPASKKWDMSFFEENYPKVEAMTIGVKNGKCDVSIEKGAKITHEPLGESIPVIEKENIKKGLAIATSLDVFPKEFRTDYKCPEYCADGKYLRERIFIGAAGTITHMHQDLFENLYTVVKGSKQFILFSPNESVYPYSRFSKLPNHAQTDPENLNYEEFPKMKGAQPYIVNLTEGETLFLPSFWWHHVKNLENSIALSFWWAYGWKLPIVWAAVQYKNLMGI